jgi:hypothetical protein
MNYKAFRILSKDIWTVKKMLEKVEFFEDWRDLKTNGGKARKAMDVKSDFGKFEMKIKL